MNNNMGTQSLHKLKFHGLSRCEEEEKNINYCLLMMLRTLKVAAGGDAVLWLA
jgi:hypothetical protein